MNVIKLKGELRTEFGGQASRKLRLAGKVPCVIYGGETVAHMTVEAVDLKPLVYTSDFNLVEIETEGKVYKTVLKDIQYHPVSEIIEHIDFQELVEGRKVRVSVPVKLFGDSLGVKEGGSLVAVIRKLEIKATPESLVTELRGDISKLNLNQAICVRDMEIPEGVEVLQDPSSPVGYVEVPRSLKSAESEEMEAAGEEAVEAESEETVAE
jgi:large subunit ribosomal protein L25